MALRGRLGRYRLVRRLAVGGMAEVYLAVAEGLSGFEKRVVVKRLLPQHARDGELVAMFLDEARLVASLEHPNIGAVYDVGAEGDEYFFAMEHVAGRDLRDLLAAHAGEPLPLPEALAIVMRVAEALHHAHEQRDAEGRLLEIVHRDVSPSNVLVSAGGQVKLVDFGVAKWAAQRTETRHGVLKGKCAYMSPEQCRAQPLDRRSDVFSLGVVLYELTTGSRPFEGSTDFEIMTALVKGEPEPPSARWPEYPAALESIVLRALAPRPEDRFATAQELSRALGAFVAGAGLAPSEAGLAALVGRLFGDQAAGNTTEPDEEPAVSPHQPAQPSALRPVAIERTATDHHAFAAIQSLSLVEPVSEALRAVSARRIAILAGIGLACVAAVAVAAPWFRKPPVVVAAPSPVAAAAVAPAPVAPARAKNESAVEVSLPPVPAGAAPAPAENAPARKKARKPAQPPPASAPPSMKVWDPDSPVPPTP
jgi:serine/threonine protein kinase